MTVEELEQDPSFLVIDIRREEEYQRGTFPGAVNVGQDRFREDFSGILNFLASYKDRKIAIMCHSGSYSRDIAQKLEDEGMRAYSLSGGFSAYLRLALSRLVARDGETERLKRTAEIERSIIKKFRGRLWTPFTKAVRDYRLIQEGDRVACCISGGKDSYLCAKLLQELQRHGPVNFSLLFLVMNPGYNQDNWEIVQDNARLLGLELNVFQTGIFDAVAKIKKNPCYLCARMRRGYLYSHARELGCNKIALAHHYDDVIETILMGMLYAGKIETMLPKLHSRHFEGMELIRPMYLVREKDIKAWRDSNGLNFIRCACRFTENCEECGGERGSKREEVKKLIADLARGDPVIESNIFRSVSNINLYTVLGYKKDGIAHSFLDEYD